MKRVVSAVIVLIGLAAPASADTKACEDATERKDWMFMSRAAVSGSTLIAAQRSMRVTCDIIKACLFFY